MARQVYALFIIIFSFSCVSLLSVMAAPAAALETEIKASGEIHLFYLDPQRQAATLPDGFTLGSNSVNTLSEDLDTDHTFVQFDAKTEESVSGVLRLNLSDPLTNTGGSVTHPRLENAYILINKIKGAPEGIAVKLGQFYVPFGLRVWPGLDYRVDRGIEISGTQKQIDWKFAVVNGAPDHSKEFYIDAKTMYGKAPIGLSYYQGRVGQNISSALGAHLTYNATENVMFSGQYIWGKTAGTRINWLYLKGAYNFDAATTVYVKYHEMSPEKNQSTSWLSFGGDYKYSKSITVGAEYIINDEPAKIDNNVVKAKVKLTF